MAEKGTTGKNLPNGPFVIVYGGQATIKRRSKTTAGATNKETVQVPILFRVRKHVAEALNLKEGTAEQLAPKERDGRLMVASASKHGKTVIVPHPLNTSGGKRRELRFQVPSYMSRALIYKMLVDSKAESFRFPGGYSVSTPNAKPGGKA